jgi:hypothetical protein
MSKAFWMIMVMGLGVGATPALAQGPKHNADKVIDQLERRDRAQRHDRTYDRDTDREHRRDIFARDEHGRPPGWDRGKKKGWGDCDVPPGLAKKQGCHSFHHESHHTVRTMTSHPVIVRRPRAEAHVGIDAKAH